MPDDVRFSQPSSQSEGRPPGFFQAPRPFTRAEFDRLASIGVFDDRKHAELIGGIVYEGGAPRRFTRAEFHEMIAAGMFAEGERVELIGGEIVSMMGEGDAHVDGLDFMVEALRAVAPPGLVVKARSRLYLPDETEVYPDILVCGEGLRARDMDASNVHLIVETSDSTFKFDRDVKAPRYAAAGFKEYWIFHAGPRRLWVYRDPNDGAWGKIFKIEGVERAVPLFALDAGIALPDVAE